MRHFKLSCLTLAGLLSITGCGSEVAAGSGQNFTALNSAQLQNLGDEYFRTRPFILGRVRMERSFDDGRVEIVDLQGRVIESFTTAKRGWFWKPGSLPPDFSVLAYQGSDVYRSEIRGGWKRGTLHLNVGTSLVSAFLKAHPEVSLAEAENSVRAYFKLPVDYPMAAVEELSHPAFDKAAIYAAIRQRGSLEAYLAGVIPRIPVLRLSVVVTALADSARALGQTAAQGVFSQSVNTAVGDTIAHLNLNFTTASALSTIESQLTEVQSELADLSDQLTKIADYATYKTSLTPLEVASANISVQTQSIQDQIVAYKQSHPESSYNTLTNSVVAVDPAQVNLMFTELLSNIDPITRGLTSTSAPANVIFGYTKLQSDNMKLPDSSKYQYYPWRSNQITRASQALVGKYVAALGQAQNLYFEISHLVSGQAYAAKLVEASNKSNEIALAMQQASQYVPDLLPADCVILDMQRQLCWANEMMPATNYASAISIAANWDPVPGSGFTGFRLPTRSDLMTLLQNRAGRNNSQINSSSSSWGDSDTSAWLNAFNRVGINTDNFHNLDDGPELGMGDNEGSFIDDDNPTTTPLFLTWNNDGDNPDQDNLSGISTSSFLICLDYPLSDQNETQSADDSDMVPLNQTAQRTPWSTIYVSDSGASVESTQLTPYGFQLKILKSFDDPDARKPGGRYGAGSWDVTNRVIWTSSNPAIASVSNYAVTDVPISNLSAPAAPPGPAGFVSFHPPVSANDPQLNAVNITATIYGTDANGNARVSVTTHQLNYPANCVATPKQVDALPKNKLYYVDSANAVANDLYFLTVYFEDGRILDVTTDPNTTWELQDSQGNKVDPSVGGFGPEAAPGQTPKNNLHLTSRIPVSQSNLQAFARYVAPSGAVVTTSSPLGVVLPSRP